MSEKKAVAVLGASGYTGAELLRLLAVHPLFEVVREDLLETVRGELERGAVFYDVNRSLPARLSVYSAAIRDGLGNVLHRRLFIVQEEIDGTLTVRQPTLLLDLIPAPKGTAVPSNPSADHNSIEHFLVQQALEPFLAEVTAQREKEIETVSRHLDLSLNELILRQNLKLAELLALQENGDTSPLLAANTKQTQDRLDELFARLEGRHRELEKERNCTIQIGPCRSFLPEKVVRIRYCSYRFGTVSSDFRDT